MKYKIKIMIIMLFILIITKSTVSLASWSVETGDIDLDWNKLINIDTTSCNTDVSHKCTNTQSCNIVVGPCKNVQETTTKTTTKQGIRGAKSPQETEPTFIFSDDNEIPNDDEQSSEQEGTEGKISVGAEVSAGGGAGQPKVGVGLKLKNLGPLDELSIKGKF